MSNKTKVVFVNHVSMLLERINQSKNNQKAYHRHSKVLIDGAQAVPHFHVDVTELDVDFYVCSAHKFCGPTEWEYYMESKRFWRNCHPYRGVEK